MELSGSLHLYCPIRGELKALKKSKDGLTPTEEYRRIEAIKYLMSKGYSKEFFLIEPCIKRFGNAGRNSFRSDFAVLDIPSKELPSHDPDDILNHALLICEVKRDNKKYELTLETQVKPMLDFAKIQRAIALYWDSIEQRVFWNEEANGVREIKEGPLSFLPAFGQSISVTPLTYESILPPESLLGTFNRIEIILHQAAFAPEKRYEIILQLLLAKIFDEHGHEGKADSELDIQDYRAIGTSPKIGLERFNKVLKRAIGYYEKHLPKKIPDSINMSGDTLLSILEVLAPIKITKAKRDVVQTFYMKFAKDLYKWDLAQYFTPTSITDFIVDVINPQFGEHICDPACGSADFLVASFRALREYNPGHADCVWGFDNSENAVQIAVLNMILNADGKTNIKKMDSLECVDSFRNRFNVIICNPPFGTRIVEKRNHILSNFELGHEWEEKDGRLSPTDKVLDKQEMGILFLEACVKLCKSEGGRIAIILPNGYLGNKSQKYLILRQWILRYTRIAAVVSLPRFSFKSSGADVSASIVYLEKRTTPLTELSEDATYPIAIELIERVGWDANKLAKPIYMRNPDDGGIIIKDGEAVIDSDFPLALHHILNSNAANAYSWLRDGRDIGNDDSGWSISVSDILADKYLTIDPKRLSKKIYNLQQCLKNSPHFVLGDLVDFIPEHVSTSGKKIHRNASAEYKYVELSDIGQGEYQWNILKGWELPDRAKHFAESGDIYFGSIWGSAIKWCVIPNGANNVVLTNGCFRCRMKPTKSEYTADLLSYLNSEGWGVQMRALARGSDGLAEIDVEDAQNVLIPLLSDEERTALMPLVNNLFEGRSTLNSAVRKLIKSGLYNDPEKRPNHMTLV